MPEGPVPSPLAAAAQSIREQWCPFYNIPVVVAVHSHFFSFLPVRGKRREFIGYVLGYFLVYFS